MTAPKRCTYINALLFFGFQCLAQLFENAARAYFIQKSGCLTDLGVCKFAVSGEVTEPGAYEIRADALHRFALGDHRAGFAASVRQSDEILVWQLI